MNKATQIKESASDTSGISIATDVFKMQIQLLLEQISLLENHLQQIETVMIEISNRQEHFLATITGIGVVTACVITGEIGDIKQFQRQQQLVAFTGLDASVHHPGDLNSSNTRIYKHR